MLYDLSTPHGRAQSYCYSAQGAMIVNLIEQAEDEALENLREHVSGQLKKLQNGVDAILKTCGQMQLDIEQTDVPDFEQEELDLKPAP